MPATDNTNSPTGPDEPDEGTTDDLILDALAAGLNQRQTAKVARVHPKTIQRRLADPSFAALVAQRRAARVREVTGRLTGVAAEAVTVISEAMGEEHPIRVRLAAAQLALRSLGEYQASSEVDARIADLEHVVAQLHDLDGEESK